MPITFSHCTVHNKCIRFDASINETDLQYVLKLCFCYNHIGSVDLRNCDQIYEDTLHVLVTLSLACDHNIELWLRGSGIKHKHLISGLDFIYPSRIKYMDVLEGNLPDYPVLETYIICASYSSGADLDDYPWHPNLKTRFKDSDCVSALLWLEEHNHIRVTYDHLVCINENSGLCRQDENESND